MSYLLTQILLYLAIAAALGVVVGWFMRRCTCNRDIATMQDKLDQTQTELDQTRTKLNQTRTELEEKIATLETEKVQLSTDFDARYASLQAEHDTQGKELSLMTSRWQTNLAKAKELPKYQTWLKKVQGMYQQACNERDMYCDLTSQYISLHTEANQKVSRLNNRITQFETTNKHLSGMIEKIQRLNSKVTTSENVVNSLYGMISQVQGKWRNDRTDAIHLREITPKLEEEKNHAQWRLAELEKKYTEQFQEQETAHQTRTKEQEAAHQTKINEMQKRIDELKPLEGSLPGQDTKFNRFMDKIRLVGTSKNSVLGRTYKQIDETKREASQKERVFVDTCEEKDAIINDLREQVRTAENRAQATSAAAIQESTARVSELEKELQTMNNSLSLLREHEHTIEAFKLKLASMPAPRTRKTVTAKPAKKKVESKPTATKPAASKPAATKPAEGLNAPAKGLKIAAAKVKDDLKLVKGIGPVMEKKLNEFGVYSFEQLGRLSKEDIQALADTLGSFPGRIERDKWVGQSKKLFKEKYNGSI